MIFNERLGEVAEKYLAKGRSVYLEGQLQTRKWQDQSGQERYTTEVVLQRFRGELVLLGGRDEAAGAARRPRGRRLGGDARRPSPPAAPAAAGATRGEPRISTISTTRSRSNAAKGARRQESVPRQRKERGE